MINSKNYDCIVIGGGVAGATAAYTLSKKKIKTLIIDTVKSGTANKIGECLSGQGIHLLKQSGLYEWALISNPIENVGDISSWGSNSLNQKDFIYDKYGSGWHLDRAAFDDCLKNAALSLGVDYIEAHVRTVKNNENSNWEIKINEQVIRAPWVIDASGRNSIISKYMGIKRYKDRSLIAVYSWSINRSEEARTLIESCENGWWYTAKLPSNQRVTVFHTSPYKAQELINAPKLFFEKISKTNYLSLHSRYDSSSTKPRGIAASGSILQKTYGKNWLAIGDAAITFDPLSAHGILNALAHGIFGAEAISMAMSGDYSRLETLNQGVKFKRENYLKDIKKLYLQEKRWNNQFWRLS